MSQPIKILVIEDDEDIRVTLKAILENEGYDVEVVATGREALDKTDKIFYNVALIDIGLPDMKGTELLTKIKDTIPRIRKIIITGYSSTKITSKNVTSTVDAYLVKPVDIDRLLYIVNEQLKMQEMEKESTY